MRARAEQERRRRHRERADAPVVYRNRDTGTVYTPHNDEERAFLESDTPRHLLAKGGEGSGKSVLGIIKNLERLRRGMSGIMVSPDLPHFKRSLWPEFRRWCPWHEVVASQQYRGAFDWEPRDPFVLAFKSGGTLLCGGIDNPGAWEGPNVHFGHIDEARRMKDASALKVLTGRIRLVGPKDEPPQLWLTSTPRLHWLYEYFGPWEKPGEVDPFAAFKALSKVITLRTSDNADNLAPGYVEDRSTVLTEAERRVIMEGAWEDIDDVDRFLPSMTLWDGCHSLLPPLDRWTPLVLAADAAVSNDCFALVAVSRHPVFGQDVAARYVRVYEPRGGKLDFDAIEVEIERFCQQWNVVQLCYDPYQLHQMMTRLQRKGIVWTSEFGQGAERAIADKDLHDLIVQRRLHHKGNADLRTHIDNADRKREGDKLRIVKRAQSRKIDAAVALSMAAARCLKLDMTPRQDTAEELPGAGQTRW
jgi:hypothetical protein